MTLKVAIIGVGKIGSMHAQIYHDDPRCEIVAVCDAFSDKVEAAAQKYECVAFASVGEMLPGTSIDIASVCTAGEENGGDHYEPTMALLNAGIAVLGEKPISNKIPEAREMVVLAREKDLRYGINLNHRFTPAAERGRKWVDEGRLGELNIVNMTMWINNPNESSPHFHMRALHSHSIDVMRYFCGEIEEVHCFALKAPGRSIYSTAQFNMRFASGCLGHLTGSYDIQRGHPMERCEVAGTKGRFVLDDMFREATLYPAGNLEKTVYTNPVFGGMRDFGDTFVDRLTRFVDQVDNGVAPADIDGSGTDGLAAQKVIAAAIESIETGTVMTVV